MQIHKTEVEVVRGSVTDQEVDAIVNAANTSMQGGGGIDGRIHRAAGPALMEELRRVAPHGAKTGVVVVTGAHKLPQKYIFHTAGPVWNGGKSGESEKLTSSYRGCLEAADKLGLSSIAYCSISTGVYRYPLDLAAQVCISTIQEYLLSHPETRLRRIVLAMFGPAEFDVFAQALARPLQES
ncbi:O-acetyl-ADP-ribose deacetylase [Capsulimonas corticalis]|uniref:O-acetyl-ADP-ribose deacetylase n=1 Tax=Capsulimonas corticalis TaxID=2219043 RepID=A0A402D4P2_9BACT|nr:macro domain-containing protein [Capsulimonas corticalis]BDI32000.1 O-acetyl-ADP-ribose deacetylase [Capsulimonas corticalis]